MALSQRARVTAGDMLRQDWPDDAGTPHDAVGYTVLRDDWATGTVTAVDFDDEGALNDVGCAASAGNSDN